MTRLSHDEVESIPETTRQRVRDVAKHLAMAHAQRGGPVVEVTAPPLQVWRDLIAKAPEVWRDEAQRELFAAEWWAELRNRQEPLFAAGTIPANDAGGEPVGCDYCGSLTGSAEVDRDGYGGRCSECVGREPDTIPHRTAAECWDGEEGDITW